ncbi:MAG TPA: DUF4864 domain-containing protein [Geminicoccaceae bacterium]|nr:DUF4864 domain-containing protein [Geminicoccaceae bacterium]
MARLVALVLALAVLGSIRAPAAAEPDLADRDRAAIRTTIERQLAAFQRDDGPAAFTYAAPSIKERFGTPENFMNMVRTGYEPVYRPREVEFHEVVAVQGAPAQEVLVIDRNGVAYLAYYLMQQQPGGQWLISGCILRRIADGAV